MGGPDVTPPHEGDQVGIGRAHGGDQPHPAALGRPELVGEDGGRRGGAAATGGRRGGGGTAVGAAEDGAGGGEDEPAALSQRLVAGDAPSAATLPFAHQLLLPAHLAAGRREKLEGGLDQGVPIEWRVGGGGRGAVVHVHVDDGGLSGVHRGQEVEPGPHDIAERAEGEGGGGSGTPGGRAGG